MTGHDVSWTLVVLAPLVILAAWHFFRNTGNRNISQRVLSPEYFKGLDFVLNEQPDKAIDIFTKMLDTDSDTVEIHFTVANLFRRRGEVERAIRIHQNLLARPNLQRQQHAHAMLELGTDYMRAGLLDRAEGLFRKLIGIKQYSLQAQQQLLCVYEQEKEWHKAITAARAIEHLCDTSMMERIAHFYCELADIEMARENPCTARDYVSQALNYDACCVRASLLEAELLMQRGKYRQAIRTYQRIEIQGAEYLSVTIHPLLECYHKVHAVDEYIQYLRTLVEKYENTFALLVWMDLITQKYGSSEATRHLTKMLQKHPTVQGVDRLLHLLLPETSGELRQSLAAMQGVTGKWLAEESTHRCNVCGFDTRDLHWQCPGCKNWNTIKPCKT